VKEEITTPLVGRKVRYVTSDEISRNEIARTLGAAIGKPNFKWIIQQEYQPNIGPFSQNIIIAQIALLLTNAEQFYQ
jgi:hypothetical protein